MVGAWAAAVPNFPVTKRREAGQGHSVAWPVTPEGRGLIDTMPASVRECWHQVTRGLTPIGVSAELMIYQLNRNFACAPHRDFDKNIGASALILYGEFWGGELVLGGREYVPRGVLLFDGRVEHFVKEHTGIRIALIAYLSGPHAPLRYIWPIGAREPLEASRGLPRSASREGVIAAAWPQLAEEAAEHSLESQLVWVRHRMRDACAPAAPAAAAAHVPLKPITKTTVRVAYIQQKYRAGFPGLAPLLAPYWDQALNRWVGAQRLRKEGDPRLAAAQQPQPLDLTPDQLLQCTTHVASARGFPGAPTAEPLLAPAARHPPRHLWEWPHIWTLLQADKFVARAIIHNAFTNLLMPSPPRTVLPTVWEIVHGLLSLRPTAFWAADAVTQFFQLPAPPGLREMLRVRAHDAQGRLVWLVITRCTMGARWSVHPAHTLTCAMLGIPQDQLTATGGEFAYIDGIVTVNEAVFRSFMREADSAHLLVAVTADGTPSAEFTGVVMTAAPAAWSLKPKRRARLEQMDLLHLASGNATAADVLQEVMRALAALCSLALPLKSFPGLLAFLHVVRPPGQLVRPSDATLRDLETVRDLGVRGYRRVLWGPSTVRSRVYVYSDACTDGSWGPHPAGWGIVARGDCPAGTVQIVAASAFPAAWHGTHINLLEAWGVLMAITLATRWPGAEIHARSDSVVAVAWLNGMRASDEPVCRLARYVRRLVERSRCILHLDHIPGVANIADGPSRGEGPSAAPPIADPWLPDASGARRRHAAIGHALWHPDDAERAFDLEDRGYGPLPPPPGGADQLALLFDLPCLALAPPTCRSESVPLLAPGTGAAARWPAAS